PEEEKKDGAGTPGTDPDGILQRALRAVRAETGDALVVVSDVCLDEVTDHGHCGVLDAEGRVDNAATPERYAGTAGAPAGGRGARAGAQRHDGRPGGADPAGAGGGGPPGHGGAGVHREVRVGVLRPVPRGGELLAARRPQDVPAGPAERAGGAAGAGARPGR